MSNDSTKDRIKVAFSGLPPDRGELLRSVLEQTEPNTFDFISLPDNLPDIHNSNLIVDAVILAGTEGLQYKQSLIAAARRMRTNHFHWMPVHIFMKKPPQRTDAERDWEIYLHEFPPNVRSLAQALRSYNMVGEERRAEAVRSAFKALAYELGSLMRSADEPDVIEPGIISGFINDLQPGLAVVGDCLLFTRLLEELEHIEQLPGIGKQDIKIIIPLVISAEKWARKTPCPENLRVSIHKLNGFLSAVRRQPKATPEIGARILSLLNALQKRGIKVLPAEQRLEAAELCTMLDLLVRTVSDGNIPTDLSEKITDVLIRLREFVWQIEPPSSNKHDIVIERIIVVEDNPHWRKLITDVLRRMLLPVKIVEAGSVAEAHDLLKESVASLVLVDLGLPAEQNSSVILDGGLSLIKQFTEASANKNHTLHRFIVLTAAENYSDTVLAALDLGISPWNYLQKSSQTWEGELQSQIQLAIKPSPKRLPNIEVFKRARRVARVEGMEITLDNPPWCLLAAFAQSQKQAWCSVDALARVLANEPYSLNPHSRKDDTDGLDVEERIKDQLPKYISDLRSKLNKAFIKANHEPPLQDFISFDENSDSYRLMANAQILEHVDEHYRTGHRPSVLVIEDDPKWGQDIIQELNRQGFNARLAKSTDQAWQMFEEETPDILSLDLELPATQDGLSDPIYAEALIARLQQEFPDIPIAILTAIPWQDEIMLEMFRKGVRIEDYLSKNTNEAILKLAASLSRLWQESISQSRILDWNVKTRMYPIEIDPVKRVLVAVNGYPINPTKNGKTILELLSKTPNVFVSRTELIEAVFLKNFDKMSDEELDKLPDDIDNALDKHITRLRQKITESTHNSVPGDHIICGDRGVLWLRGIVQ